MVPFSFSELQNALLTRHDLVYITFGAVLVSVGLHYASKVNRVNEGEPPLLPGALPVFGHALAFMKDTNKLYETARDWGTNSHPVSLSIAGKRLYVVLNPKDVAASWRTKALSFDPICVWGMEKMFGMTKAACQKMATDPDGQGSMFEHQHQFWRDAFAPGQALNSVTMTFLRFLETDFAGLERDLRSAPNGEQLVSLRTWCRDRMGIPSTNALIGPKLLENEPKLLEYLTMWDKEFFKLAMGLPKWMTGQAYPALENMIKAFMKWGLDEEEMLIYLRKRAEMIIARGADEWDQAAANFSLWSGTQINVIPTMFWLFYEILLHPKERAIIEQEIAPAFSPSPSDPNVETLSDLDVLLKAPLLNAMYWEALRYSGGAVSTREVIEDTLVNGWKFEKGGMVMIPLRPNHQDPKKYGEKPDEFIPDRFLGDFEKGDITNSNGHAAAGAGKAGPSIKSMKPFGGGVSLCPGRFFAANQGLAFVATALRKFDFQLVEGQKEAKPLLSVPVTGTYPPDREVSVRIRLRK